MSGIPHTTTEKAENTDATHKQPDPATANAQTRDPPEKSVEERFNSLSLGDKLTFEGRKPLTVTGDFTDNPFHAHVVLRGPRGGRHIVAMSGPEHNKKMSLMKDDYITVDREIDEETFRITERQDPDGSELVTKYGEDNSKGSD